MYISKSKRGISLFYNFRAQKKIEERKIHQSFPITKSQYFTRWPRLFQYKQKQLKEKIWFLFGFSFIVWRWTNNWTTLLLLLLIALPFCWFSLHFSFISFCWFLRIFVFRFFFFFLLFFPLYKNFSIFFGLIIFLGGLSPENKIKN